VKTKQSIGWENIYPVHEGIVRYIPTINEITWR